MKIKKKTLGALTILIILAILTYSILHNSQKDPYKFQGNTLAYSQNRPTPNYQLSFREEKQNLTIYNLSFESKNFLNFTTKIYGLLFLPKSQTKVPALVFLPAGAAKKEQRAALAELIANQGVAVLVIDQRGIGETGGYYLNFEQDFQIFSQGSEPIQHISVYDALASFDVLQKIKEIDKNKIAFSGESMGGRYALLAAALEPRSKGVLVISSAGFNVDINPIQQGNNYLVSIDPDHYVSRISPRQLIMIHTNNDTVIPLENAQTTFSKAKEPKKFFLINECQHGYCDAMWNKVEEGLKILFP